MAEAPTDVRYQVMADDEPIHNFGPDQEREARALVRRLRAAGKRHVSFWDTRRNPLSKFFTLGGG